MAMSTPTRATLTPTAIATTLTKNKTLTIVKSLGNNHHNELIKPESDEDVESAVWLTTTKSESNLGFAVHMQVRQVIPQTTPTCLP